jgi:two-component system chemotaxis sensor kinase CheA
VDKLDHLLRQAGEIVAVKLTAEQRSMEIADVLGMIDRWKQNWSSVSSHERTIGKLLLKKNRAADSRESNVQLDKLVEFLEWNVDLIKSLEVKLKTLLRASETDSRLHGTMVDDLLEDMMNVMMLPCSSYLEVFPKLVRDLARERHKEVNLVVEGGDLEIDRRILVEMKDPLIHLVRNCIDHGIETPDERENKGKLRYGTITITIAQVSGNQIELVVSDDGAGIDAAKVREAAITRGAISEPDKIALEGQDALSLVFHSEVSTSPVVSTLSGRGLGLAIVREKVRNLGGNISLSTAPNAGASFRILLPVTLSTFRGILVEVCERQFVLPTAHVERVGRIQKKLIKTVGNRDTIEVDGHAMPLVSLETRLRWTVTPCLSCHLARCWSFQAQLRMT